MKQTLDYQRDEHHVHLIWYSRRRKPVLVGKRTLRCQHLIEQKCQEKGWQILTLAIQSDHLHLFVRCFPSSSAAEVVKECKGITSFCLRKEFPELLKLPSLWTRSSFARTVSTIS